MKSQRSVLALFIALATGVAAAQSNGLLRSRTDTPPLGLQAGQNELRLPCGSFAFSCGDGATLRLYASTSAPRSLSMQLRPTETAGVPRPGEGLDVSLVGKAAIAPELGLYGRVGTTFGRAAPALPGLAGSDRGLTYGIGLSWNFSRSASAAVGLDSYDARSLTGDSRDVRTSLGLHWRY